MPRSVYQPIRASIQLSYQRSAPSGGTKELHLHLPRSSRVRKMKLPGVISLRNALPTCAIPNGGFCAPELQHVAEVDEDALCGLRAQVHHRALILDWAHVGLEHEVELARL